MLRALILITIILMPLFSSADFYEELEGELESNFSNNNEVIENIIIKEELPEDNNNKQKVNNFKNTAVLQALNKITTKISMLTIKVNESIEFGNLDIIVYSCWTAPLDSAPENKILLKVIENIPGEDTKKEIFYGWMFASSPALSALLHPVYDIIAVECKNEKAY